MLTPEILHALLHGLPAEHLDPSSPLEGGSLGTSFLEPAWQPFVRGVAAAVKQGADPVPAVSSAIAGMTGRERSQLTNALSQAGPVMALPDLTRCEREALIALRSAGVASVTQLSRLLNQNQDNLRKRLKTLVAKGYVVKFHHRRGYRYFAAPQRIDPSLEVSVHELLNALLKESAAEADTEKRDSAEPTRNDFLRTSHNAIAKAWLGEAAMQQSQLLAESAAGADSPLPLGESLSRGAAAPALSEANGVRRGRLGVRDAT